MTDEPILVPQLLPLSVMLRTAKAASAAGEHARVFSLFGCSLWSASGDWTCRFFAIQCFAWRELLKHAVEADPALKTALEDLVCRYAELSACRETPEPQSGRILSSLYLLLFHCGASSTASDHERLAKAALALTDRLSARFPESQSDRDITALREAAGDPGRLKSIFMGRWSAEQAELLAKAQDAFGVAPPTAGSRSSELERLERYKAGYKKKHGVEPDEQRIRSYVEGAWSLHFYTSLASMHPEELKEHLNSSHAPEHLAREWRTALQLLAGC